MKLLIDYAMRFVGVPYKWGGSNPMTGLDCSGFVQIILDSVGMDPKGDQTSQSLHDHFFANGIKLDLPEPGALCFYGRSSDKIIHVAFCLDENRIIEAAGGDSTTVNVSEAAKQDAYVKVKMYNRRRDLIAILKPKYQQWVLNG